MESVLFGSSHKLKVVRQRHRSRCSGLQLDPEEIAQPNSTTVHDELDTGSGEVVDVEDHQPCVVDLTSEDEDEVNVVEVVHAEQPVIYLGTETRQRRRRRTTDEENPTVNRSLQEEPLDLTAPPVLPPLGEGYEDRLSDIQNLLFGDLLPSTQDFSVLDFDVTENRRSPSPRLRIWAQPWLQAHRNHPRSRSPSTTPSEIPQELLNDIEDLRQETAQRAQETQQIPAANVTANPHTHATPPITLNHNVARPLNPVRASSPIEEPDSPPAVSGQPTITCPVCFDSLATIQTSQRTLCSTVCGHVFCSVCIEETVKRRKQCPTCRKKLNKRQYHTLYI
ncbi:uncharacterized protein LOC143020346 isoform X2 [Oratosquilla oratoria]|uniref:uncharacterized protein LOC143020346 isoform X2 n=1 Tax=Oratosquilla oratoria TaxID=337810 RepID=UPI003F763438